MSEYKRLSDEELTDAISRIVVQLNQRLTMQFLSITEELIQYREKFINGQLVELPCKVGDTVYGITNTACKGYNETSAEEKQEIRYTCMTMNCDCDNCKYGVPKINKFVCAYIILSQKNYYVVDERFINYRFENVFYSKEKAEERLKLLQGTK